MARQTTNLSIRMDVDLKRDAEKLFSELGMSLTTAITVFMRQALREQRIPFELTCATPNATTIKAMEDARRVGKSKRTKTFSSVNDLMTDLKS